MSECPYKEPIIDEDLDAEFVDDKYFAWHEGYEACKKDLASWANELGKQLEDETRKTKLFRLELIAKYNEDKENACQITGTKWKENGKLLQS
jgi:hypothetical protein